jgi:hypothetical protein
MPRKTRRNYEVLNQTRERRATRSVTEILVWSGLAGIITTGLVFGLGRGSFLAEAQLTVQIFAGLLFLVLFCGLYWGIRLKHVAKNSSVVPKKRPKKHKELGEVLETSADVAETGSEIGVELADFGDEGCLVALLIGLLIFVALLLFSVLIESGAITAGFIGIWWLLSRAVRQAFIKSRICRANFRLSLQYAFGFTLLYSGWAIAFIVALRYFSDRA